MMVKNTLWVYLVKKNIGFSLLAIFAIALLLFMALFSSRESSTITIPRHYLYLTATLITTVLLLAFLLIAKQLSLFVTNTLSTFNEVINNTGHSNRVCIKNKPEEFIQLSDNFNILISQLEQSAESNQQASYIVQSMQELLLVVSKTDSVLLTNSMFENLLDRLNIPKYGELNDDGLFTENKIDYLSNFNIEQDHPFALEGSTVDTLEAQYVVNRHTELQEKINIKWRRSTLLTKSGKFNGFIFTGTDVTSVNSINEELRIRNHAIEAASNGVAIIDIIDGMSIIYVNPAFEEITGYTYQESVGNSWQFLHGEKTSRSAIATMNESLNLKKSVSLDLINYRKNGKPFWNELSLSPVYDSAGKATHYLLIQNDVTERIQSQQEIEKAIKKAELANKAKSEFLANMSHEIRTPMNAVLGMSALCLETNLDNQQKDYVEKIHQSGSLLLSIINDILDFSKIEVGKLSLDIIPFSLSEVFEKLKVVTDQPINSKNLQLNIDIQKIDSHLLKGDPLRLGQVLLNLVTNSIKFTEQGKIDIIVSQISKDNNELALEFIVRDTGIGMTQEQAKKIFQSFSQADNSITRKYGGSGLGLTICQSFVHMMKGDIGVESTPDIGTTITFTASFIIANEDEISSFSSKKHKKIGSCEHIVNKEILIVEDNLINQQVAKEIITKMGAKVFIANNGQEAVDAVQQQTFSLVLMDLQMPVMDGLTATQHIRNELGMSDLTIIAMTANAMTGDRELCIEAGMNDYITKPIDLSILKATLSRWLSQDSTGENAQIDKPFCHEENENNPQQSTLGDTDGTLNDTDEQISELHPDNKSSHVLDREEALKRLSGDNGLLDTLLTMFLNEHINDCQKIREALDNKDYPKAKMCAHTLKGVSGSIGAISVFTQATALDATLKNGYSEQCESLLTQLSIAMDEFIDYLQQDVKSG